MPPSGTLVSFKHTHLSLSSCCIEDWAFVSSRAFTYLLFTFCTLFLLQTIHTKTPKLLLYYYCFLVDSANQYLQLLVGSTTFLIEKYYNWSPALGSHQDTFLAPLSGSVALLVSGLLRKLLLFLLFTICLIMDLSSREAMSLTLYELVRCVKNKVKKPPEPKVAYQIPIGIAKRAMKLTFFRG